MGEDWNAAVLEVGAWSELDTDRGGSTDAEHAGGSGHCEAKGGTRLIQPTCHNVRVPRQSEIKGGLR
jgi:hypothetical protein